MNKGFLILGAYFLLLLGSSACQDDSDDIGCTETLYRNVTITKLDLDCNYMIYEDSHYKPSTKELMDTINYNNYGIQITHETEEEEVVSLRYFSNRIISSAYAANMEFLPLDTISTIQIITNQDFDSLHLAGSNVTDLFVDSWNQNSIQEALENDPYFYLSQSFKYYVLTTSPTTTKSYDFTVKYNFTNGKVLETTIDKVVIQSQK